MIYGEGEGGSLNQLEAKKGREKTNLYKTKINMKKKINNNN